MSLGGVRAKLQPVVALCLYAGVWALPGACSDFFGDASGVMRYDGSTGAFLNTFMGHAEEAARLAFGKDHNIYVANSSGEGSVTKIDGSTGSVLGTLRGGGLGGPVVLVFRDDVSSGAPQSSALGLAGLGLMGLGMWRRRFCSNKLHSR